MMAGVSLCNQMCIRDRYHHAVIVVPFIKFKRSEVNPCASTYFLILNLLRIIFEVPGGGKACLLYTSYVDKDGKEEWSPVSHFYIDEHIRTFNPPSLQEVLAKLPKTHPRILLDAKDWDNIIERNKNNPEAQAYIRKANKCLNHPLKHLEEEIDTTQV